ncbi:TrmH family RNA methyltransferase [Thermophagus sp. OGC60D27]|uniref:TrmH family RNA methyltransferase n=1 Tax=Thermophagus sp. OGC60D27 TaxID=3458415 RepID=UPI00403802B7
MSKFLTTERFQLFERVIDNRTNYLTVVLENIFHSHNASAVLRSCDCFGVQDVHIIDDDNNYEVNPDVALGASKWLSLHHYADRDGNTTQTVLSNLKKKNYRIIATVPDKTALPFYDLDICNGPVALILGNEKNGISDVVRNLADDFITIPMIGFTESLNISVAAAIMLQHFSTHIRKQLDVSEWKINYKYRNQLLLAWMRKSIKKADLIEKAFKNNRC